MNVISRPLLASAAVFLSSSLPIYAQSLAQSVIEEYFAEAAQSGLTVQTGGKTISGNTVEWKDVVFLLPEDEGSFGMAFIRAEEIGGDKVSVTYPEEVSFNIEPVDGEPPLNLLMNMVGVEHIISGTAEERRHDYSADSLNIHTAGEGNPLDMNLTLSGVVSSQVNTGSDIRHYAADIVANSLSLTYSVNEDDVNMASESSYSDFRAKLDMDLVSEENVEELLNGKRNFSLTYSMGAGKSTTDIKQPDFSGTFAITGKDGNGAVSIQDGIFAMKGAANSANYVLTFAEMPLPPFEASFDSVSVNVSMPTKKTAEVLPANLKFSFDGIKASDTLWGMIDPTGS